MPGLRDGMRRLLDTIYPPRCVICQRLGASVCAQCLSGMHPPDAPICAHCGATIPHAGNVDPTLCPDCAAGRGPMRLEGVRAASAYSGPARQAILALKFGGQRQVAERLATLMTIPYQCNIHFADLVIPVPLHASRLRERGYNQAEALARAFARLQGLPVRTDILLRARATQAQTRLSRLERRGNVAGAFALTSPAVVAAVRGKRIVLVDDVTTTGSTIDAAAEPLRAAGVASVWGLAFARPGLGVSDASNGSDAS